MAYYTEAQGVTQKGKARKKAGGRLLARFVTHKAPVIIHFRFRAFVL